MLELKIPEEQISEVTGLTQEEIEEIKLQSANVKKIEKQK